MFICTFLHAVIVHTMNVHFLCLLCLQLDEMLEKQGVKVDKVLNFAIDDAILEERITGRWIHPSSGRTYHSKFAPPNVPGVDDVSLHLMLFAQSYSKAFLVIQSRKVMLNIIMRCLTSLFLDILIVWEIAFESTPGLC